MKKTFKIFLMLGLANLLLMVGSFTFITGSVFKSSFQGAGITFQEVIKKDVPQEKIIKFQNNISIYSENIGRNSARKMVDALTIFFPAARNKQAASVITEINDVSIDQVTNAQAESAEIGIDAALQILVDSVENNKAVKAQALSTENK